RPVRWKHVIGKSAVQLGSANTTKEPTMTVRAGRILGVSVAGVFNADWLGSEPVCGPVTAVDSWIRNVLAQYNPVLNREVCPFITRALDRCTIFYAPVVGCRSPDDVIAVMEELISQFAVLRPHDGPDAQLKTLVAIFVDVQSEDAASIV